MKLLLYFSSVGDWMAQNAVAIVTLFLTQLGIAGGLLWKLSKIATTSETNGEQLKTLAATLASHVNDLDGHVRDNNVHTTFEQRQAINARFDKIERDMTDGHNRIENKIDKLIDWSMKK